MKPGRALIEPHDIIIIMVCCRRRSKAFEAHGAGLPPFQTLNPILGPMAYKDFDLDITARNVSRGLSEDTKSAFSE